MPNGNVHALSTTLIGGIVSPLLVLSVGQPTPVAVAFAAGCLVGIVVNPDLDVRTGSHSYDVMKKTGGSLVGRLWRLLWQPYARLIPSHRHPLSHFPVLGTILRLGYMIIVPVLVWWLLGFFVRLPPIPSLSITPLVFWGVLGLMVSDTLHTLLDWFWPWR